MGARLDDGNAPGSARRSAAGDEPGSAPRGSEERAWLTGARRSRLRRALRLKLEGAWGGPSCSGFSQAAARHALMAAAFLLPPAPLLVA